VARYSDVALIAGLGVLAYFVIKGGRDLFGALGGIKLPSIGDITLPNITLPSINLPAVESYLPSILNPSDPSTIRRGDPNDPFFKDSDYVAVDPHQPAGSKVVIKDKTTLFVGGTEILGPSGEVIPPERPLNLLGFKETPRDLGCTTCKAVDSKQLIIPKVQSELRTGQQFSGGGPSFVGGTILETPISNLSLGQIIEKFGVGATEAADIRARARNDFPSDFDFGTNTGSGIGSITVSPIINTKLPNSGAVSNSDFAGLSAEQIAKRLTGGNINNW